MLKIQHKLAERKCKRQNRHIQWLEKYEEWEGKCSRTRKKKQKLARLLTMLQQDIQAKNNKENINFIPLFLKKDLTFLLFDNRPCILLILNEKNVLIFIKARIRTSTMKLSVLRKM